MLLKKSQTIEGSPVQKGVEQGQRFKLYLAITLILVGAALAVALIPKGTPLQRCNSLVFLQSKYSCISQLAISSSNASMCSYLPGNYSASCYSSIAENSSNASLCRYSFAKDSAIGSECFAYFANMTGNVSFCANIIEPYKFNCVTKLSVRSANVSSCSMLSAQNQTACSSAVYLSEAIAYRSASFCSLISSNMAQNAEMKAVENTPLLSLLGGVNGYNSYLFPYMLAMPNESISLRDLCYLYVAKESSNSSICNSISSSQLRQLCATECSRTNATHAALNASQVLAACNETSAYMSKSQCITYLTITESIATHNLTWCKSLGPKYYDTCYSDFASAFKNSTYCSYITNATANSACLANLNYSITRTS